MHADAGTAGPERFLEGYRGYLQADAYVAYDSFFTNPARGLVELGCWAHARRHVYQARETDPRGIAVGRNNWTFFGSDRAGKTMAILRSFVASCELLKLDPFEWFRDILSRIPTHSIQQLDQLLPHAWSAARA